MEFSHVADILISLDLFLKLLAKLEYESLNTVVLVADALTVLILFCSVEEHKGKLVVTLQNMLQVSPVAQVILYTLLHNGEAIADSINLSIQPCLANKVRNKHFCI